MANDWYNNVIIMGLKSFCLSNFACALQLAYNPFRRSNTESHWVCQHYWHHHRSALDPSELYCRYCLPDRGSTVRREIPTLPRYGGSIIWLLHDSWFGARRGLWHQYPHCNRRGGKQADHIYKANTSWWFNSFTLYVGRVWCLRELMQTNKQHFY